MKVSCKKRKGGDNFVSCMRKCLENEFADESVGLGGVFCAQKGQVKIHVMPEFSSQPLKSDADVENWLNFYPMDGPFTCFSVFVSKDPVSDFFNDIYQRKLLSSNFLSRFLPLSCSKI